jgi:hypothetical protein
MHNFLAPGTRRNFLVRDQTGYSLVVAPPTGYISATIKTFEGTTTMANEFSGRGNLGADPELRYTASEDSAPVCLLRVFFDRPKPDGNGGFDDKGGFGCMSAYGARAARPQPACSRKVPGYPYQVNCSRRFGRTRKVATSAASCACAPI